MANYTLRIELLGNPSQDVYADLHARMQRGGFSQTITGTTSNGQSVTKPLPHATYYGSLARDLSRCTEIGLRLR